MSGARDSHELPKELEMERTLAQLRAVLDVSRALSEVTEESELLSFIAKSVCERLQFGLCVIGMHDPDGYFRVRSTATIDNREVDPKVLDYVLADTDFAYISDHATRIGKILWIEAGSSLSEDLLRRHAIYATEPTFSSSEWHGASVLFAPLELPDGTIIGYINPDDPLDGRLPSEASALVLETLTYLATAAIELVRSRSSATVQLRIVEAQRQQVARLFEASTAVKRELQLEDMLSTAVRTMAEAGGFRRVALYLIGGPSGRLSVRATYGLSQEEDDRLRHHPVDRLSFAPLMQPGMLISRSYLYDHRKHEIPSELLDRLSVPTMDEDREEGLWHPLDSLNIPMLGDAGELLGIISVDEPVDGHFPDLSHVKALEFFADQCAMAVSQVLRYRELTAMAETDPLTKLPNRRTFTTHLYEAISSARREEQPISLLFMDLDHFKVINDTYGHLQGDRVLREISGALKSRLRKSDLLARFGGEEFVAILPLTDIASAQDVAETLRRHIENLTISLRNRVVISLTISFGVAGFDSFYGAPHHSPHLLGDMLLKAADSALYDAKTLGRNVVCTAPSLSSQI